jgi:pimeloyl-ACP methyl ester carboxylesterase
MGKTKIIYAIPGLATDERLFKNLHLPGFELRVVKWEVPSLNETMTDFAKKIAKQIDASKPFHLLGISFGGMCAVEISKFLNPEKLILISTAKGADELPLFIRIFRYFPLHRLLSQNFILKLSKLVKYLVADHSKDDRDLLVKMLYQSQDGYLNGSINCIVTWNCLSNTCRSADVIQIHGTKDRVIPSRNIKNYIPVKGGNHFMILNRGEEISYILLNKLNQSF